MAATVTATASNTTPRNGTPSRMSAILNPHSMTVTKRSGKTCTVVIRYAAQARLGQAVFHWARASIMHDPKSRDRYKAFRARGHSYGRALRGVADRLLGVACVLLRRRIRFDPDYGKATAA